MAETLQLELATPGRLLLSETVTEVEVPGANGILGILPQHAPLISELGSGELKYTPVGATKQAIAISDGWVEVLPDRVRILALRAEFKHEIDLSRAEAALKRAEERLSKLPGDVDIARAINAMRRARARIVVARAAGPAGHDK